MEPEAAVVFKKGTPEYSLLWEELKPPAERVRREDAHQAPSPRQRWKSALGDVVRNFVHDNHFQYSKVTKGEIRILHLHKGDPEQPLRASLFKRKLKDAFGGYEALSYCWGSPNERNTEEITIRDLNATVPTFNKNYETAPWVKWRRVAETSLGVPFPIRKNLYQALVKLRRKTEAVNIWVDAICIDQSERGKGEKEEQLSQMAEIYNSAANVCIWLGDAYEGSSDGIHLVKEIMNLKKFDILVSSPEAKDRWSHLIQIMKAPWFSRRWIIQEVALSRNASIHCADEVLHWDDFADAVSLLTEKIDIIRGKFTDEIFEDVEATSACILVHTLTNVCRKSDKGKILAKLSDLETLVSTLLGFQASFPRDTIYSILALARDAPKANEPWEELHFDQLNRNHQVARLIQEMKFKGKGKEKEKAEKQPKQTERRKIGLTANYKSSTRDLFIAFVTRSICHSESLDIICRHWAPPVREKQYGQEVQMPSWISGMSKAEYGLLGTLKGRQNGENFVAYSPLDRRQRYKASGASKAVVSMVQDPFLDPPEIDKLIHITDKPFTQSPLPSPTVERFEKPLGTIKEEPESSPLDTTPNPVINDPNHFDKKKGQDTPSQTDPVSAGDTTKPSIKIIPHTPPSQSFASTSTPTITTQTANVGRPVASRLSNPARKPTQAPDVELEHELSGILSVKGFILGTISECSDVMRGGIIPGDWVYKMGWQKDQYDNLVPDMLWRLLVADRTHRGGKPPQWYKRSCLHGLVDPRMADVEGNLHSVTPVDRHISEMTTKYFKRVERVVLNRRIFQADPIKGIEGPLIGLAPKSTKVGDIVCILLGCTVPVILKQVQDGRVSDLYELVGESYVHGMMDGEAVEDQELVDASSREFKLC